MTNAEFQSWMREHRYSVRSLAESLGMASTTIQKYRTGELPVTRVVELALDGLDLQVLRR